MIAPTKRRHFALYKSLPLVVAIVLLLVAKLAALQRADIIAHLTDRVDQGSTPEATAAVRQLAAMPHPPIATLVAAASSSDRDIADEAQLAISRMLRRCQRDIDTKHHIRLVSRQLAELAELLDAKKEVFSTSDQNWLGTTARKILRLANRCSLEQSPLVAVHCDAIIESIATSKSTDPTTEKTDSPAVQPVSNEGQSTGEENDGRDTRHSRLEQEFAAYAAQQADTRNLDAQQNEQAVDDANSTSQSHEPNAATSPDDDMSNKEGGKSAPVENPLRDSEWSQPVFRMLPAAPLKSTSPNQAGAPTPSSTTLRIADANSAKQESAELPSRELIKRWLAARGIEAAALERELSQRGFSRLSPELAQRLFSHDPHERLQLVDDVLTAPGVNARPWLIMLAGDSDAEVRLAAVTIMATSSDPALIEKAWQTAIRDRDPRIADLAVRLRDRRGNTQRR